MSFMDDTKDQTYEYTDDDGAQRDDLPRIQWRNGDPKSGTPGYFFFGKANAPDGFTPEGDNWAPHTEYFQQTKTRAPGWRCDRLPLAIITTRARPYVRNKQTDVVTWYTTYQSGVDGAGQHVDVLCVADGLQALGPVVWSTNSTKCAFAIIGRANAKRNEPDGILEILRKKVIEPAYAIVKRDAKANPLPPWCVWVTIETERDAKGEIVYSQTRFGSDITRPVFDVPPKIDLAYLNSVSTGKAMMEYGKEQRALYDTWKHADFATAPSEDPASAKNTLQETGDDDGIPF